MNKKVACPLFLLCIACFLCTVVKAEQVSSRGLFVSLIQDPPVLSSRSEILKLVDFAQKKHIQTIFIQVYRSNEAWFSTRLNNPETYKNYFANSSGDSLQFLIQEAHRHKIQVHAWLNLLSLGNNKEARILKKYGEGILTRNHKDKKTIEEYKIDGQYFLEPSDRRVRRSLLELVEDLLHAYPSLDGLQFDYIRYPDEHPAYGYSPSNMQRFKKRTGQRIISEKDPLWRQWKRDQVTGLLSQLVHKVRKIRPGIQVSITGCLPFTRAYDEAFQDWPAWVNQGLVDFVTVMNYPINIEEFDKNIQEAKKKILNFSKVNIAIGAYKFIHSTDGFAEELQSCEKNSKGMCVIFHYGNLLDNPELSLKRNDGS